MTAPHRSGQLRRMDAGVLEPEIGSFRLYLASEGQVAEDDPDLHRRPLVRRRAPARLGRQDRLGSGRQA
jgi:hypothetical protein